MTQEHQQEADDVSRWAGTDPNGIALRHKSKGIWLETSWSTLDRRASAVSRGLASLGVGPGSTVAILAENSAEWVIADLAIRRAGAVILALPTRAATEQIGAWLGERGVSVAFCGDQEHLDKLSGSAVTAILFDSTGIGALERTGAVPLDELEQAGGAALDSPAGFPSGPVAAVEPVERGLAEIPAESTATAVRLAVEALGLGRDDRVAAIAPFSDATTRSVDLYASLRSGAQLYFPETLTSVPDDLREIRPTVLTGPRRLFQLILHESRIEQRQTGSIRRRLIRWGLRRAPASRLTPRSVIITRPIAARHGLSGVSRAMVTGDERLPAEAAAFLAALRIEVLHGRGGAELGGLAEVRGTAVEKPGPEGGSSAWASQFELDGSVSSIEASLRDAPCVRSAVVEETGSGLSAIIELDLDTTVLWATDHEVDFGTRASLCTNPAVRSMIEAEIVRVNSSLAERRILDYAVAPRSFGISDGLLSPTLVLRRERVLDEFRPLLQPVGRDRVASA